MERSPNAGELTLTLELGSDPIAGVIVVAGGSTTRFQGYAQLIAELERVRAGQAAAPGTEPD